MPFNCSRDCVGIRYRINSLHQTWKWLHQTIALHEYLISMSAADTNISSRKSHHHPLLQQKSISTVVLCC
ncbi:uncharacterized protein LOC121598446 [Anopheles merus]|uniref:Uncharacterized protein n=1 Tax=Anopheles quadriannulatus TaxID=34691 RepID=A0A182WZY7_ANOQN|nr:uncharacterized protein LOC121598446 [Anopheles merus]XP_061517037.1 uncharacterized protein LOC133393915 [Anopheles gambiae]